jgi:hypothetical protein
VRNRALGRDDIVAASRFSFQIAPPPLTEFQHDVLRISFLAIRNIAIISRLTAKRAAAA